MKRTVSTAAMAAVPANPTFGVVGSGGAFGKWLVAFMRTHYPASPEPQGIDVDSDSPEARKKLVGECDVVIFSVPIAATPGLIREYASVVDASKPKPLWLDVTSLKAPAVEAFSEAAVEAVGLHPMCAPPPTPSLHGRKLVVCQSKPLERWSTWFDAFLRNIRGHQVHLKAEVHDRLMSLVQAGCHAGWLAQAHLWSQTVPGLGGLDKLLAVRTPSFALLEKATCRILCGNPDLYADIQLQNPEVPATLRNLAQGMLQLADTVQAGDRTALIDNYFTKPRESLGTELLSDGNTDFERLSHLLADLDEPHPLVLTIVQDSPGTLSTVLAEFASNGVNLRSIQSVRAKDGSVRFHLCLDRPAEDPAVTKIGDELSKKGLIKLWDSSM